MCASSMHASVSLCVRVCICACVCMYLYIVQGPEVAVLDWYGPETDPVYIQVKKDGRGWQDSR